ncbi:hypothetical protein DPMN_058211 [Dreissena polymorpha]|uniref:Uncharacterized protein n=1 Tax=Dreissena polymorpha TaxID=45954 RepID=A0A9D4C1K9_DREPO|nr:hypothetical protein DPMN_058211 [Dreissena polymorpha]
MARLLQANREASRDTGEIVERGITRHRRGITRHRRGITRHRRGITRHWRGITRHRVLQPRESKEASRDTRGITRHRRCIMRHRASRDTGCYNRDSPERHHAIPVVTTEIVQIGITRHWRGITRHRRGITQHRRGITRHRETDSRASEAFDAGELK